MEVGYLQPPTEARSGKRWAASPSPCSPGELRRFGVSTRPGLQVGGSERWPTHAAGHSVGSLVRWLATRLVRVSASL